MNRQVEAALSEEARERTSISGLKTQLLSLQQEVEQAVDKLSQTQTRVEQNLQRVNHLKAEAVSISARHAHLGICWCLHIPPRSLIGYHTLT